MDLADVGRARRRRRRHADVYASAFLSGPLGSPRAEGRRPICCTKYFPNDKPQIASFYGMSGAYAVVDALRRAGPDLTRDKFVAALECDEGLPTPAPAYCKINFTPQDHQGCSDAADLGRARRQDRGDRARPGSNKPGQTRAW